MCIPLFAIFFQVSLLLYFKIQVSFKFNGRCTAFTCTYLLAIANLRAVLEAMARSNPTAPHPITSGVMLPGAVVLISNLNEKVRIMHMHIYVVL